MRHANLFEVVTPVASAALRRLTSAANVRAVLFESDTADDTLIGTIIDRVSGRFAWYCGLARDAAGTPPTFGRETLRATFDASSAFCAVAERELKLPWRVPVTSISSVTEDGSTVSSSEYRIKAGGFVERLDSDGNPSYWSAGKIVVQFIAGWDLSSVANVPPEVEGAAIEQVKLEYLAADRDPAIASEAVPEVYSARFNVAGSEALGKSGLLFSAEAALTAYRRMV